MSISKVNTVAIASIAELNGIATVSIGSFMGETWTPPAVAPLGWSPPVSQAFAGVNEGAEPESVTVTTSDTINDNIEKFGVTIRGMYESVGNMPTGWIKIALATGRVVKRITLYGSTSTGIDARNTKRIKIEASTDDSNWDIINSNLSMAQTGPTSHNMYANTTAYRYFKFYPLENWGDGSYVELGKVYMFTDADDWEHKLNCYDWPTWSRGDDDTVNELGKWDGSNYWQSNTIAGNWAKVDFGVDNAPKAVKCTLLSYAAATARFVKNFTVQGSNDDSNWDTLYTGVTVQDHNDQTFNFTATGNYRYYKINIVDNWGDGLLNFTKWLLYSQ